MWRTGTSGVAVTTDSVMTSRISMGTGRTLSIQSAPVAPPTATQLAWRGRIEAGLRVAAPFLDLLLAAGDRLSRAVDRDGLDAPAPPRAVRALPDQRRVGPGSEG
jgi:hypothetical protein